MPNIKVLVIAGGAGGGGGASIFGRGGGGGARADQVAGYAEGALGAMPLTCCAVHVEPQERSPKPETPCGHGVGAWVCIATGMDACA